MGNYSKGVENALNIGNEDNIIIAKFIASNAPNDDLKKKLWIKILSSSNNQQKLIQNIKDVKEPQIFQEIITEQMKYSISLDMILSNFPFGLIKNIIIHEIGKLNYKILDENDEYFSDNFNL